MSKHPSAGGGDAWWQFPVTEVVPTSPEPEQRLAKLSDPELTRLWKATVRSLRAERQARRTWWGRRREARIRAEVERFNAEHKETS